MPILTGQIKQISLQAQQGGGGHFCMKSLNRGEQTSPDWDKEGGRLEWSSTFIPVLLVLALMKLSQIISNWAPSRDYIQIISDTFTPGERENDHLSPRNTQTICQLIMASPPSDGNTLDQTVTRQAVTRNRADINKNLPPPKRPEFLFGATRRERRWFASKQDGGFLLI